MWTDCGCAVQVFAPLARMLGLHTLVVELEDLSFAYSQPDDHRLLQAALAQIYKDQLLATEQVSWLGSPLQQSCLRAELLVHCVTTCHHQAVHTC